MQKYETAYLTHILSANWLKQELNKMRYTVKCNSAHAQTSHPKHGTVLVPLMCFSITTHLFHWWTCLQYNDMWPRTPEKLEHETVNKHTQKYLKIKHPTSDLPQHLKIYISVKSSFVAHDTFYIWDFPFVFSDIVHSLIVCNTLHNLSFNDTPLTSVSVSDPR